MRRPLKSQAIRSNVAIHGAGTSTEPRGILNQAGIGSVVLGANGGTVDWATVVDLESRVSTKNADTGSMGYLTSAAMRGKLKKTLRAASAGSDYIWSADDTAKAGGVINSYRAMSTSSVRADLTKGTGTNLSPIIFGNWESLIIATWGALSLETNPYSDFRKGRLGVRVLFFADVAIRNPEGFSACTDGVSV